MSSTKRSNVSLTKDVPQKVFDALQLHVWGRNENGKNISWQDCADASGLHIRTLRKYREFPECIEFIKEERRIGAKEKRESLHKAYEILLEASPDVATRLVKIALDPQTKDYVAESACVDTFKIIKEGITDDELRHKLDSLKEQVSSLERGGPIFDI